MAAGHCEIICCPQTKHSPGDEHRVVMVSHPVLWNTVAITVMRQDGLLPFAETVQRFIGMMVDLQIRL